MIEVGCSQYKSTKPPLETTRFFRAGFFRTISDPSGKLFGHLPGKVYLDHESCGTSPRVLRSCSSNNTSLQTHTSG
jgi:hypothetical protein